MADIKIEVVDSLEGVDPEAWDALTQGNPFVSHAFLHAMHTTRCAVRKTGWQPQYLLLRDGNGEGDGLAGAMPLYLKGHSRGEYVFDHAWAEAFERHGIDYYPKLLSAVPFTPVRGPRLMARDAASREALAHGAITLTQKYGISSLHVLFPDADDVIALRAAGYLLREGVQFHWHNASYDSFETFLAGMNHDKRKKIRQDRRRVADAGVTFRHVQGAAITQADLDFFYRCYASTYENHWSSPYLNPEFFQTLLAQMPESVLLILAEREGAPIASALNILGDGVLYGRYWGSTEFVSGLHFETCYLQAIEFCIQHGVQTFEGGAQGEHKMSRGLLPTPTWSAHWIADERFAEAIADFLERETKGMGRYLDELESHTPFKASAA
ncbi:GNAT family N-acetyltransferase [Pigmentiphaga litoralis]|uniref:GNAT family N-acetyltransferase n=1 Tax=Pigmentiphaga litoralis TaxID=516702 RepID=A0A7Y9LQ56_9BURK|nr:GNAT family N-acetyltransferase [Pigmentiphaga litoralis]NYE26438.1 hypothetical protein [Pigmentiphaga litoralis]NYE85558.1 hypothetical protein [Pigmentiphaga litoralis]